MNSKPSAVIISVTSKEPDEIIKLILDTEDLPEPSFLEEHIPAYSWHIDTKYYTADINLCSLSKKTIGSKVFAQGVGAVVINFDSEKEGCLEAVESWLPFIKEFSPEVQILLCERCTDNSTHGAGKVDVQHWCVDNKFELVELSPEPSSDQEEEDEELPGLAVTTGVRRVVQALHAHLWPNMNMKERTQHMSPAMLGLLNGSQGSEPEVDAINGLSLSIGNLGLAGSVGSDTTNETSTQEAMMQRIDELLLGVNDQEISGDPEMGPEAEFGALLSHLGEVKAQMSSMPNDQRLACAEQVVMAFWRAIGGDEEELEGLQDDINQGET